MFWETVRVLPNNTDGRERGISASFLRRKRKRKRQEKERDKRPTRQTGQSARSDHCTSSTHIAMSHCNPQMCSMIFFKGGILKQG